MFKLSIFTHIKFINTLASKNAVNQRPTVIWIQSPQKKTQTRISSPLRLLGIQAKVIFFLSRYIGNIIFLKKMSNPCHMSPSNSFQKLSCAKYINNLQFVNDVSPFDAFLTKLRSHTTRAIGWLNEFLNGKFSVHPAG